MKRYNLPERNKWQELAKRPAIEQKLLSKQVECILDNVKINGDKALVEYSKKYDGVILEQLKVSEAELATADDLVDDDLKAAIQVARQNIEKFHATQTNEEQVIETTPGVSCWRKSVAIEKVGLYIPGGTAPLFSTILMLGIPAKLAGCKTIILCTPPNQKGEVHPAILYTAKLVGITQIYKVGGAQAIAAMTFGTETIPQVYKLFGPGNQYVTKAKELVQQSGVAIDMPAGPSEILIIADTTCEPAFVAADLLSQAEHGVDSQVILLSDKEQVISEVMTELEKQLEELPRKDIATQALKNSSAIFLETLDDCINFSNAYAPEHLILAINEVLAYADKITNAGSVFLGSYSCESAGDYASGTNHTLPTNGYARNYSGVSLDSFVKKITFQQLSKEGITAIGESIELMAEAEGLHAHKNAVSIRLKAINNV